MLSTLAGNLLHTALACGGCIDLNLLSRAPFLGWWLLLFIGWSLLLGPLVFTFVNAGNATDLPNPARLCLWFFGLVVASMFLTEGSLMLPFVLLTPFWIAALIRGIRCHSTGWRKFCVTAVGVGVLLVPVSYAMPMTIRTAGHGDRAASPRTGPATPGSPSATPPAPSLQDALPAGRGSKP